MGQFGPQLGRPRADTLHTSLHVRLDAAGGAWRVAFAFDLMISTLRKTIEAMGGNLSLAAEFPDREPVVLAGIAEPIR